MPRCCEELTILNFYVSTFLEGVASFLLVFIGGSAYVKYERPVSASAVFEIALIFGGTLTILSQCLKDISKAHINPAISLASTLTKRISLLRGFCYIVFQFSGAIAGAYALNMMVPEASDRGSAMTQLSPHVSLIKGILYEMIYTFVYAWLHFASRNSRDTFKGFSGPLATGIFYGISHIMIIEYTGCSLNPARSLGPAIYKNNFDEIWVYLIGPFLAASLAGLIHDFVIMRSKDRPYPRARSCSITCCKPAREEVIMNKNIAAPSKRSGPDIIIYPPLDSERLV